MAKVRDSQRSKVYRAENTVQAGPDEQFDTIKAVRAWLLKIIRSARFQKRFPWSPWNNVEIRFKQDMGLFNVDGNTLYLSDGRGCTIARGGRGFLVLPGWARNKRIVLHELAHALVQHRLSWRSRQLTAINLLKRAKGSVGALYNGKFEGKLQEVIDHIRDDMIEPQAAHGPLFCDTNLWLTGAYRSTSIMRRLEEAYITNKVKY